MNWVDVAKEYPNAIDNRDVVTSVCHCGGNVWNVALWFDDETYEIAGYDARVMQCLNCGSYYKAPTELDKDQEGMVQ